MTIFQTILRYIGGSAVAVAALSGTPALAGSISDLLFATAGANQPLCQAGNPPVCSQTITEAAEATGSASVALNLPAGQVDFAEPGVNPVKGVSDSLSWQPFMVTLQSTSEAPPGRDIGEVAIVSFIVASDTEAGTMVSDELIRRTTIVENGTASFTDQIILTTTGLRGILEAGELESARFNVSPQTIGLADDGVLSDTLTIGPMSFLLNSDGDPCNFVDQNGCVLRTASAFLVGTDGGVALRITAISAPEPATLKLLLAALTLLVLARRWRHS